MEEIRRLQEQLSPEGQAWWAEAQRLHSSQASPEEDEERLGQINRWAASIAWVPRQDHDALGRLLTLASKAEREIAPLASTSRAKVNRERTLRMNRLSAEGRRNYFDVVRAARTPEDESHDREIAALSERIASLPAEE